jgi:parallel beta-helix repeat protein
METARDPMSSTITANKLLMCVFALLMVVPNIALAAMPTEQNAPDLTSSRGSRVLEACPDSAAGWTISGVHDFTGSCSISGGHITVQAGAVVTFEAVDLTHTGAYYIYNYASLKIINSTITGTASWNGIYGQTGMTLLRIENSTIKGWTGYGARATVGVVEIGNSTFEAGVPATYGFYLSSVDGGYLTNNKVNNATSQGIYVTGSSTVTIENNIVTTIGATYGAYLNGFDGVFDNNTIIGGDTDSLRVYSSILTSFKNNKAIGGATSIGLYLYNSVLSAYYCKFSGSTTDVTLASNAKLLAYETRFNTLVIPAGTSLEVYWRANITIDWLSTGQGIVGAHLNATNDLGTKDPRNLITDFDGQLKDVFFLEYSRDSTSIMPVNPYWFNATAPKAGKILHNETRTDITNATNDLKIIIDDVPPPLKVLDLNGDLFTNQTTVQVQGQTERNDTKQWPIKAQVRLGSTTYRPAVDQDGLFQQDLTLPADGVYPISVQATDWAGNVNIILFNITRDTVAPPLTVTAPADGTLTNNTTVAVTGTTEPGVNLTINGKNVTLNPNGSFTVKYNLTEGANVLRVKAEDKALNSAVKVLNVKRDTRAPVLIVSEPSSNFTTNQATVQLKGTTEAKAILTVNGQLVQFTGSAFQTALALDEGYNIFKVMSCDAAKNCNLTIIFAFLDSKPPRLEVGSPSDGTLTNVAALTVEGVTELGAKVSVNGYNVNLTGTSFSYDLTLKEGKNTIWVDAFDAAGNKAEKVLTVTLDTQPPLLTIQDPVDGATINKADLTVDGTTETGALITVNGQSVLNKNGSFTTTVTLKEGPNNITVGAVDKVGNRATTTVRVTLDSKVSLTVDRLSGATPLVTTNATVNITGKTDPDAIIDINGLPVTLDMNGNFMQEVYLDLGMNNITVVATDPHGNKVSHTYQVLRKAPTVPPKKTQNNGLGGMLLPIGIAVAALVAIGVGAGIYMKTRSKPEEAPAKKTRVRTAKHKKAAPPPVVPEAAPEPVPAPPPPAIERPPPKVVVPPPPPPPPPPAESHARDVTAPEGITPEAMNLYNEAERHVDELEASGQDATRCKTHLRVAQSFLKKGNSTKVIIYSMKVLGRE